MKSLKNFGRRFFRNEDGLETIEMVIILVVLVTLAFAFRRTLFNWYNTYIGQSTNPGAGLGPASPAEAN